MLQVNPKSIELIPLQKRYNIRLSNNSEYPLIFKIRSTNTLGYYVQPNAGFLRPGTVVALLVTVKLFRPFNDKIQLSYSRTFNYGLAFEEAWREIINIGQSVSKVIVDISLSQQQQNHSQQSDDRVQGNHSKVKLLRRLQIDQMIGRSSSKAKKPTSKYNSMGMPEIRQNDEYKDLIVAGGNLRNNNHINKIVRHFEKERKKYIDAEQRDQMLFELEELQRKLKKQKNWSARLKRQLQIAESSLRQSNMEGERHDLGMIHSMGVMCEQNHISLTGLALIALSAFILGYALAAFG